MKKYQILLYYKYVEIENPTLFIKEHKTLCEKLDLKGRILIAHEGINGTVEGTVSKTEEYIRLMINDLRFKNMHFKKSEGTGSAFPKLSIKLRDDIVSNTIKDFNLDPNKVTGKYLSPEELHEWIKSGKRFFMVDMRNDYETAVGYFKGSILAPFENFRDMPKVLPVIEHLKGETILTVCTGGVRCEKASGFLLQNGFNDVYQLFGGIVSYMEKYPNEDFLGKLYVFDGRITMGFNTDDPKHVTVGKCAKCGKAADVYYDCKNVACEGKRHFISCKECIEKSQGYCDSDVKVFVQSSL